MRPEGGRSTLPLLAKHKETRELSDTHDLLSTVLAPNWVQDTKIIGKQLDMATTSNDPAGPWRTPWDFFTPDMINVFPDSNGLSYNDNTTISQDAFFDLTCPPAEDDGVPVQKTFSDISQGYDDVSSTPTRGSSAV